MGTKPSLFIQRVKRHENLLPLALLVFFTLPISVGVASLLLPESIAQFSFFIGGAIYYVLMTLWMINYYKLKGSTCPNCENVIATPGWVWKFMIIDYFCPKCGNDNRVE